MFLNRIFNKRKIVQISLHLTFKAKLGLSLPAKACYARTTHACIANCDTKNNKKECHRKLTSGCLARVMKALISQLLSCEHKCDDQ